MVEWRGSHNLLEWSGGVLKTCWNASTSVRRITCRTCQVAWVIEFEGQRVLTKHAANHLTYRYCPYSTYTSILGDI